MTRLPKEGTMNKSENNAEELMRRRRRRRRQALGFALCLLAVVGLGSLVAGGVQLAQYWMDDSDERAAYEQRLTYVVMLDMLPFSSLAQANQSDLLESCIWATLFNEDSNLYERDEKTGALLLPSAEVDRYAAQLFGPDYKLTHDTFESEGMTFQYDTEAQSYIIPITGQVGNYTPKVVEISGSKSVQRVSVGYLVPYSSATDFASSRDVNEPVKYYDYLFTRAADGNYYLTSMEESSWKPREGAVDPNLPPEPDPNLPQLTDPNLLVNEATNSEQDAAINQELENAQSQADSEGADQPPAGEEGAEGGDTAPEEDADSTPEDAPAEG